MERSDRVAAIRAEIATNIGGIRLGAPSTTDELVGEDAIIDPMMRYAADAPEEAGVFGGNFVMFGYDDTGRDFATNTRDVLRDTLAEKRIDGERVSIRGHAHHPPAFAYEAAVPIFQNPLKRSRRGDDPSRTGHAVCWATMPPNDVLAVQSAMRGKTVEEFVDIRQKEREVGSNNITNLERGLRASEPVVPAIIMELNTDGENIYQEGRTRAFIARELDIPWVNVLFAVNKKK